MAQTRSTCPYCGVGCGVIIESDGGRITGVRGDPDHPANFGRLCSKGSTLHLTATEPVTRQTRLLQPMRRAARGEAPVPLGWDDALDHAAERFAAIIRDHGPDAVGFYISGQLLTEDYYVFNKLAKGLVGTNNVDTNSRLCMSSAVAGYKLTLGADAPPACYEDLSLARTLFIAGSNAAYTHPVLFRRIEDARAANPELRVIVADPRRTATAEAADLHLPIQPGTDVALFNGMLHVLLWEGWVDRAFIDAHVDGFDTLRDAVRDYTPREAARICGIDEAALLQAAQWFGANTPTLSLYCQGLNQSRSGTDKNAALINLHLATGQIGKPGAGPFSLTGQPNAMGGREVGGMANLLSAHRELSNAQDRAEVARLWGVDEVPAAPGKTAVEMFEATARGEIKALWIACTNPAQSMPDQATVRKALQACEFVVLQEAFATTATCAHADLLLPATTWGEKDGTVTNSERRISRVRPAVTAPGEARHDWRIVVDFARRLEERLPGCRRGLLDYGSPESIWNEHRESTRGRDLDITGLSYDMLERDGPQCWPMPEGATEGRLRLYADGRFPTANGRARFAPVKHQALAEPRDARYPFSLGTGRLRDQWHGMSRTGTLGKLFGHVPEPTIDLHPSDLARLRLADGELVHVSSRRGSIVMAATANDEVAPTQAFVAMHWGEEVLSGASSSGHALFGVNALTTPAFCPSSRQPELKHTAVKILRAEMPWELLAMAWLPVEQALQARERLKALMPSFAYAHCVPFGREPDEFGESGLLFRAAAYEAAPRALVERIESLVGLSGPRVLRYVDGKRGRSRALALAGPDVNHLQGFVLAGDASAQSWLRPLLVERRDARSHGRMLLAGPGAAADAQPRRREVCSCHGVSTDRIEAVLAQARGTAEARLVELQHRLRCGTNCGSCLPELRTMVSRSLGAA